MCINRKVKDNALLRLDGKWSIAIISTLYK